MVPTCRPSKLVCTWHGGLLVAKAGAATATRRSARSMRRPRATDRLDSLRPGACCPVPGMLMLSPIDVPPCERSLPPETPAP